jgi:hypothetical protein
VNAMAYNLSFKACGTKHPCRNDAIFGAALLKRLSENLPGMLLTGKDATWTDKK